MLRSRKSVAGAQVGLCLAMVLGAATVARAEDETATRSVAVSLRDLDLTSQAGRVVAQQRIDSAAHEACEAADVRHLHVGADYLRCRAVALGGASAQLQRFVTAANSGRPSVVITDTVGH